MGKRNPPPPPPPPPPQSGADRPGGARIFAFLVGIDHYESDRISDLNGCVSDVENIESFLRWRYWAGFVEERRAAAGLNERSYPLSAEFEGWDSLHILKLTNEAATYKNIIEEFRSFAGQALKGDVVWFHFSGLGAAVPSAVVAGTNDECLLCYDAAPHRDARASQNILSDKEIAVLLQEIADPFSAPQVVVTLDSCFSSRKDTEHSNTLQHRSFRTRGRGFRPSVSDDYFKGIEALSGYYESATSPPTPPRVLMTASANNQLAFESLEVDEEGGLFTNALVEVLTETQGAVSYRDLVNRISSKTGVQEPQLETTGDIPAYGGFLEGGAVEELAGYAVKFRNGHWTIDLGRIHGLPEKPGFFQRLAERGEVCEVNIYSYHDHQHMGKARIEKIWGHFSQLSSLETLAVEGDYYGVLNYLPVAPEYVVISGDARSAASDFIEDVGEGAPIIQAKNIRLIRSKQGHTALAKVHIQDEVFLLERIGDVDKKQIKSYPRSEFQTLLADLIKIVNWKRLLDLKGPAQSAFSKADLGIRCSGKLKDLEFDLVEKQEAIKVIDLPLTSYDTFQTKSNDRKFYLYPNVQFDAGLPTGEVYVYLFELWPGYAITSREGKKSAQLDGAARSLSNYNGFVWGLGEAEEQNTLYLKLIVSQQPLSYTDFLQKGVVTRTSASRNFSLFDVAEDQQGDDWYAITVQLNIKRDNSTPDEEIALNSFNDTGLDLPPRHAFVIGINQYPDFNADLLTARSDAEEVAMRLKVLQQFENVFLMQDVGAAQILSLLNWLSNRNREAEGFSIDDHTFYTNTSSYTSRTGWLKTEQELPEEHNQVPELQLITGERQSTKRTPIYLVKESACYIGQEDAIVFYFAGHGYPGSASKEESGGLVPTDAQKGRPE
jgi:hypothetical protein